MQASSISTSHRRIVTSYRCQRSRRHQPDGLDVSGATLRDGSAKRTVRGKVTRTSFLAGLSMRFLKWMCVVAAAAVIAVGQLSVAQDPAAPRRIYLNEFRPATVLKVPEHHLKRAKYPVVNVHTHLGPLSAKEIDEQVAIMDEANIAAMVSLDGRVGPSFPEHYQMLTSRHADRFIVFVRMDYVGDGAK